jgi:hypothetical protein
MVVVRVQEPPPVNVFPYSLTSSEHSQKTISYPAHLLLPLHEYTDSEGSGAQARSKFENGKRIRVVFPVTLVLVLNRTGMYMSRARGMGLKASGCASDEASELAPPTFLQRSKSNSLSSTDLTSMTSNKYVCHINCPHF